MMKDFDWQEKFGIFVVSMATWMIEYNLKTSLLLSLDFLIRFSYKLAHSFITIWNLSDQILTEGFLIINNIVL